ncbi:MAG: dihydropteroate synthase [Clostridiales Family XIII bacterium]|jgi:5-methyltetrahydrofolate corrinoid/iron sulfur protein methyltransferase|nr:dihydropteroate synthase [Clostridiales Family XIII bacterium]
MDKFIVIGERIHCISPEIREAMAGRNPEPLLRRGRAQLDAGANYLDLNIGPAEKDGEELMMWAVKLLQENLDNVPLVLDTANKKAIEAGISVYNGAKGKPVVNSADAGERISYIDVAAENGAIAIALCSKHGVPKDNDERMAYCQEMLEYAMERGMEPEDLWFDPLTLVIKGMQEKQKEYLEFIRQLSDMGLNSTAGISNASNGMPKEVRPIVDSTLIAMAIECGLTSAIVNPNDKRLMETVKTAAIIMDQTLYADSYLDI